MCDNTIKLNVGGTPFETSRDKLMKCPLFAGMLSDIQYTGEPIFIDRSPHIFKHILAYLRDPSYPYPIRYVNELKYFLIDASNLNIYDQIEDMSTHIDDKLQEILRMTASDTCIRKDCYDVRADGYTQCDYHKEFCSHYYGNDEAYCDNSLYGNEKYGMCDVRDHNKCT